MTSILGEHINEIRPTLDYQPKVYKNERPRARNQARTRTIKKHCGKVVALTLRMEAGGIRAMPAPATHAQVMNCLVDDPNKVVGEGWVLENGTYLWK